MMSSYKVDGYNYNNCYQQYAGVMCMVIGLNDSVDTKNKGSRYFFIFTDNIYTRSFNLHINNLTKRKASVIKMRRLWYNFNIRKYNRKIDNLCSSCIAYCPLICKGLKESTSLGCQTLISLKSKLHQYESKLSKLN